MSAVRRQEDRRTINGRWRMAQTRGGGRWGSLRPVPLRHGTRTGYVYGCRCDECRDAEARYSQAYKAARR